MYRQVVGNISMMATRRIEPGPVGQRIAGNVSEIREAQRLSQPELARRITEAGRPMTAGVLSKTEQGDRRVDVDDLVAFALALGVTPNRLLLDSAAGGGIVLRYPGDTTGEPVHTITAQSIALTPNVEVPLLDAWAWAAGERPLPHQGDLSPGDLEERASAFRQENRPHARNQNRYVDKDELRKHPELVRQAAALVRAARHAGVGRDLLRDFIEIAELGAINGDGETNERRATAIVLQPVVAAIVTNGKRVLITARKDGKPPWGFVTGEVEPGEHPEDAAIREVKEETGLEVRLVAGPAIGERDHPATARHIIYLAAKPVRGTRVAVGDEAELAEVRWVSLAEAEELLPGMFEPVRDYLAKTLKG